MEKKNKIIFKLFSFRNQIIFVVVALATIPLFMFGFNALKLAGKAEVEVSKVKNTLLLDISREARNYFKSVNKSLAFVRSIERRQEIDLININRILINALQRNRQILGLGYVKERKMLTFLGEDMRKVTAEKRAQTLLDKIKKEVIVQLSFSYKIKDNYVFDLLYPLDNGDFVYVIYTLKELVGKLESNKIGKSGEFCLIGEDDIFFVGGDRLQYRFKFLEVNEIFKKHEGGDQKIIDDVIRGYQLKAKRMEGILWPFWLVFTQKEREVHELTRNLTLSTVAVLLVILFVAGGISFVLAKNFSRPIASLLMAVKSNQEGELDTHAIRNKKDPGELGLLIDSFNNMIISLKDTREKLIEKEQLAAVGEMASIIGHDIRNPLAAIKNAAYFIGRVVKDENERVVMSLDIINREIKTITDIIEDLLGFSRQRPPARSPVDVNELISEVITIIEPPENVKISTELKEDLPVFNLDRGEIRQVLVNLINNAVQACKKPDSKVSAISDLDEKGNLKIVIRDNGMGIPKDKLDNIFKAFWSTKEGGTGLGMSSAKNIINRHEGTINVHSVIDQGTDMILLLPPKEV